MFCSFIFVPFQERLVKLLNNKCKCSEGSCFKQFNFDEVKLFMDHFECKPKRDQDTILFLALGDGSASALGGRREFHFLGKYFKRVCFEALLGISSHRVDRLGALDMRFGSHPRASPLSASIDTFCMVLYNSVAEPLPNKLLDFTIIALLVIKLFELVVPSSWANCKFVILFFPLACSFFLHVSMSQLCQTSLRFIRVGPAKAPRARSKVKSTFGHDSSSDGFAAPSEIEQNDEELAEYLQANTSFLVNMNATGAFSEPWIRFMEHFRIVHSYSGG